MEPAEESARARRAKPEVAEAAPRGEQHREDLAAPQPGPGAGRTHASDGSPQDQQEGDKNDGAGPDQEQVERRGEVVAGPERMKRKKSHGQHDTEATVLASLPRPDGRPMSATADFLEDGDRS